MNQSTDSAVPRSNSPVLYCPQCGFDLCGLPDDHRCPECGFGYQREAIERLAAEHVHTRQWLSEQLVVAAIGCCSVPILMLLIDLTSYTTLRGRRGAWIHVVGIALIVAIHTLRQWLAGRADSDGDWRLRSAVAGWVVVFVIAGNFPHFLCGIMLTIVAAAVAGRFMYQAPYPFLDRSASASALASADWWSNAANIALPFAVIASLLVASWR